MKNKIKIPVEQIYAGSIVEVYVSENQISREFTQWNSKSREQRRSTNIVEISREYISGIL